MLLEQLFENLALFAEPFAVCEVSSGWRLRLDGRDWVTLHFALDGEGALKVGSEPARPFRRYTLAIVPPRLGHVISSGDHPDHETAARAEPAGEGELVRFLAGPRGADDMIVACGRVRAVYGGGLGLFDLLREPIALDFADSPDMRATFERLVEEQRHPSPASTAMTQALMSSCLVMVFRRLCEQPDCPLPWLNALEDPRLAPAVETVLSHPDRRHSVESLASTAKMSRSAFAEEFPEHFGRAPMAFVREVRMRRAAELLRSSDLPIESVAHRVGYSSRSQFSRAFGSYFGRPPSRFRDHPGT